MGLIIHSDRVSIETKNLTKSKALVKIAQSLSAYPALREVNLDWKQIFHQLSRREKEGNTYIDNGVALPHVVYDHPPFQEMGYLAVIRLSQPLNWQPQTPPVNMIWGVLSSAEHHLQILKEVSGLFSRSPIMDKLRTASPKQFLEIMKKQFSLMGKVKGKAQTNPKRFSSEKFLSHCHYSERFFLPPGFTIHARPATAITELCKSLPGEIYFVTTNKSARGDSITDLLSLGGSSDTALTLAVRYPATQKKSDKLDRLSRFSFQQIQATIMNLSLEELSSYQDSIPIDSGSDSTYYRSLIKEVEKHHLLFQGEQIATRYNPETQGNFIGGMLWVYKRSPLPPFFNVGNVGEVGTPSPLTGVAGISDLTGLSGFVEDSHTSLDRLQRVSEQLLVFKKATLTVIEEIEESLHHHSRSHAGVRDVFLPIMDFHINILKDEQLHEDMKSRLLSLRAQKKERKYPGAHPITTAWDNVIKNRIRSLDKTANLSKISDWQDLDRRMRSALWDLLQQKSIRAVRKGGGVSRHKKLPNSPDLPQQVNQFCKRCRQPVILVCDELYPSEVLSLTGLIGKGKIAAIIIGKGSKNSHAAIMLSNISLPVIYFSRPQDYRDFLERVSHAPNQDDQVSRPHQGTETAGNQAIIDLRNSRIMGLGDRETKPIISRLKKSFHSVKKPSSFPVAAKKTLVQDHLDLEFFLNLNSLSELKLYQAHKRKYPYNQIKGAGLIRTELFFSGMKRKPSLSQQIKIYRQIAEVFHPLPVVIRTLDFAKDKPLTFLPPKQEDSRYFQDAKKITQFSEKERAFLGEQIEAVYRASLTSPNIKILFPMIASLEDFFFYYRLLHESTKKVSSQPDLHTLHTLEVGVMIETPALIYQLQALNRFVDFYSLGGNDLEQFLTLESRHGFSSYSSQHLPLILATETIMKSIKGKPLTFCGNQVTDSRLLTDFISAGVHRFSISTSGLEHLFRVGLVAVKSSPLTRLKKYFFK